jgi:hypothetical protein
MAACLSHVLSTLDLRNRYTMINNKSSARKYRNDIALA